MNPVLTEQFSAFEQQNAVISQQPMMIWNHPPHPTTLPPRPAQPAPFLPPHLTQQSPASMPSASTGWVDDFQRLGLSNAPAGQPHNQLLQGPVIAQPLPFSFPPQYPVLQPFSSSSMALHPISQQFGGFTVRSDIRAPEYKDDAPFAFDAEAQHHFEQEFVDAMDEWMLENGPQTEMSGPDELNTQRSDDDLTIDLEAASAESIAHEAAQENVVKDRDQETELARAAQQLVDCVADNDSEKFKNSEFIALMRRIASQQLTVQGNDLVERPQSSSLADTNSDSQTSSTTAAGNSAAAN
ncbi:hypothetical protein GGS24DRAFT_367370 [Hypoxylon argillaceum]|nr:hypothetical protein GGS24DRAFT_367370 [Hypoxylon argillaceum]